MPKFKKKEYKENRRKSFDFWWLFKVILVVSQAIVTLIFLISLATMGILDFKWILLIGFALVSLLALNGVMLLRKKQNKVVQGLCITVALICIAGSIFAFQYTNAFNGFLNRVTNKATETKWYSVVVPVSSEIDEVGDLARKSAGLLKSDITAELAEKYLKGEAAEISVDYYNDLGTMVSTLSAGLSDAMIFEAERYDILTESAASSVAGFKIAFGFKVEYDSEAMVASDKEITTEPFILYISGSDSRTGIDEPAACSDVNILAVVNPNKGKILLVTIPRDTYVQLHGTTGIRDKLTHAGIHSLEMSKTTIEDFLDIKIDYVLKVGFEAVVGIVDQLDGVEITSDTAMTLKADSKINPGKKCYYSYGKQVVDGECALRFARERKKYSTGDLHRGENQQEVLTGIINKLSSSKEYLLKLPSILDAMADSFRTNLSRDQITTFIRMQLANQTNWKVESIGVTGEGTMLPTYTMGENWPLYVMIADENSVKEATAQINEYLGAIEK